METAVLESPSEHRFAVLVVHDGAKRTIPADSSEAVSALLGRALHDFGIRAPERDYDLFRSGCATGLPLKDSLKEAGIRPDEELILKLAVSVLYNGVTRIFAYVPPETVQALTTEAMHAFGITAQPHTYGLFAAGSTTQLPANSTLKDAGVKPGNELLLRQVVVQGGA